MAPNGRERIGCRPSDGLVLALRMRVPAPILVDERLLEEVGRRRAPAELHEPQPRHHGVLAWLDDARRRVLLVFCAPSSEMRMRSAMRM